MIDYIARTKSIITGNENLEELAELKSFPAFIGCTDNPVEDDILADMKWDICLESGMIQLRQLLPLDLIYSAYHSEALGETWKNHHYEFAKFIKKYQPKNILEIGGSNGFLAKHFTSDSVESEWTIIEPNPAFLGNDRIKVINGYFDNNFKLANVDTVIHSHVIEHFYDPNQMLEHISGFLEEGKMHIFSLPNLREYLQKKYSNTINFEHTYFITDYFLEYLLLKHGFEVVEKMYYADHSIFYAARKKAAQSSTTISINNYYSQNKELYLQMLKYYDDQVEKINGLMEQFSGDVFLFGAHIFSQFLVYKGLDQTRIKSILDNSEIKKGKRLYGTALYVDAVKSIEHNKTCAVILKAGQYQEEVKRQILLINPATQIWE